MVHYDIALIGSGSANSIPGPEFAGKTIAQIDAGPFGGTCLNVGCIPTKMFAYTAKLAHLADSSTDYGVDLTLDRVNWPAIRDRIFSRIDSISDSGADYRDTGEDNENLTLYRGTARMTGPKTLTVTSSEGTTDITADTIIIGAGSRPSLPDIDGMSEAEPYTSDTIMRLDELPQSLMILGSGFIAAEFAHIFSSLGVNVRVIARSGLMMRSEDADIAESFTRQAKKFYTVDTHVSVTSISRDGQVTVTGTQNGQPYSATADEILVATGRTRNTDTLDCAAAGYDLDGDRLVVDSYQRVLSHGKVVDGVWALGDISSPYMLKHVANHELRVVRHNLLNEKLIETDHRFVPHAVFSDPEIGSVGLQEKDAPHATVVTHEYAAVAYGWAMEETDGFIKLIIEPETTKILGAHIIGPQASSLIQILIQAMSTGQTARDIARGQYWIHPALPELVENALLKAIEA